MAAMPIELAPGASVGRYVLVRLLGRGGMGSVWVARDDRLGREVAVKVLPEHMLRDPGARRRFEREARALARLLHPNIVTLFDMGVADPGTGDTVPYLVMELVEGTSLERRLAAGPFPPEEAVAIGLQVARALGAAHAAGVVHRDLKPSNVMVTPAGHVKVLDFGLARLVGDSGVAATTLTAPGMVMGSCPYMAPEQALGEKPGPPSDVFAFGALLYEMLSGRRAFVGGTPLEVMERVTRAAHEPLEEVAPGVPQELAAIVARCLERDPERRYRDGAHLAADLERLHRPEPLTGAAPRPVPDPPEALTLVHRRRRRRTLLAAGVAAALGLLLGGVATRVGREPRRPDPGRWQVVELARLGGELRQPAWSPDGHVIVVNHVTAGRGRLLAVEREGGRRRVIAEAGPGEVLSWPRFSPDGRAIAVTVTGGASERVEVIPAVGGPPVLTVAGTARAAWTPGGDLLLTRYRGSLPALFERDLATGEERELLAPRDGIGWWDARARADGTLAVLGGPVDVRAGVWVVPRGGGEPRRWLEPGGRIRGLGWVPGREVLAAVVDGALVRIARRGLEPVLPGIEALADPAFSPDGRELALTLVRRSTDLVVVDPDGGAWSCALCGGEGVLWGSAAPGGWTAFSRAEGLRTVLYRRGPAGEEEPLGDPPIAGTCPVLSPTGDLVAYLVRSTGERRGWELHVAPPGGGAGVTVAEGVEGAELPSWSPDGTRLAYAAGSPLGVWVAAVAGGSPVRVADGDYPRWSPDGRWIAYLVWTEETDPEQGVWVVHPDGTGARRIGDEPAQVAWRPDGGALWQLRRSGERLELWECDVRGWRWRRRSTLDLGGPAAPYQEHVPFTVDRATGRLLLNVRRSASRLVVLSGLDPSRW